jgi:hypothetical protein
MGCCPPAALWKSLVNATIVQKERILMLGGSRQEKRRRENGDGVGVDAPGCVHGLGTPYEEWLTL